MAIRSRERGQRVDRRLLARLIRRRAGRSSNRTASNRGGGTSELISSSGLMTGSRSTRWITDTRTHPRAVRQAAGAPWYGWGVLPDTTDPSAAVGNPPAVAAAQDPAMLTRWPDGSDDDAVDDALADLYAWPDDLGHRWSGRT